VTAPPDAVTVELVNQSMAGIVREMQSSLFATGYSVVIRESHDASCAITDPRGRVIAQHTVLPLHLGAFPGCVEGLLEAYRTDEMAAGDAFVVNHPYLGGSPHASDMAVISPILIDGTLFGFSGSMAHKPDIGGLVPGSNSGQAREIFHEGLMVPPVRLYRRGELVREVQRIIAANSRSPDLVVGDLRGQAGATWLGAERVQRLCARLGWETVSAATDRLLALTEQQVRAAIRGWPDGVYHGEASLHNDGVEDGRPVRVRVRLTINGDRISADFRDSDDQTTGPYNIRPHLVRAVCYYVLTCLTGPDLPSNHGLAAAIETDFRDGSVVCPRSPAPVNTYMPIALATAEALFAALAPAVPRARIAESSPGGTAVTGTISHRPAGGGPARVQYEILAGAMGARADKDGVSATSVHVRNASLTPIEILESEFPVEVTRFELVADSGGPGRYRGGLGMAREYRLLGPARRTGRGGRELTPPHGRAGGLAGRLPRVVLNPGTDEERMLTGRDGNVELGRDDVLRFELGGAGGFGDPWTRPPDEVLRDVREGYVSADGGRRDYGVAVIRAGHTWAVDARATAALRADRYADGRPDAPGERRQLKRADRRRGGSGDDAAGPAKGSADAD
jgi:N-methylhydantoinase B